jgi:hypothetical protein
MSATSFRSRASMASRGAVPGCATPVAADSIPASASELHKLRQSRCYTRLSPRSISRWQRAQRTAAGPAAVQDRLHLIWRHAGVPTCRAESCCATGNSGCRCAGSQLSIRPVIPLEWTASSVPDGAYGRIAALLAKSKNSNSLGLSLSRTSRRAGLMPLLLSPRFGHGVPGRSVTYSSL